MALVAPWASAGLKPASSSGNGANRIALWEVDVLSKNWERVGLAISRIVIGYLWFTQLLWKPPPAFGCSADFAVSTDLLHRTMGLCDWVGLMAKYSILPLHAAFVQNIVAPNISWMGWGIFLLEVLIAVSLVFGVLTRLGAVLGFVQSVNLYLGLSALPIEWYWSYGMLIVLHMIFFFTNAGLALGVDQFLIKRLEPRAQAGNRVARLLLALA